MSQFSGSKELTKATSTRPLETKELTRKIPLVPSSLKQNKNSASFAFRSSMSPLYILGPVSNISLGEKRAGGIIGIQMD